MKKVIKRTTAAALTGILAVGMLAGCGTKKLDGNKTVATVNGTEIPLGIVSLYARQTQAQTEAMYMSFMGSAAGIWSQIADEESGQTYGEQVVSESLKQIEQMYILKEKAADYNVEVTEDDQTAIAEAASKFMEANSEDTLKELAVTEDQVKTLLELETYRERIHQPIADEANVTVTDEEAQQSSFTYVAVSTSGDELTDEDKAKKKEDAEAILEKVKEDPSADMNEIAKSLDETYSALSGTFFTTASDDENLKDYYPDEALEALRTLNDGEVYDELVETDTNLYVLRLDEKKDEDATESKKESIKSTRENEYYAETTDKWLEEAEVTEDQKVLGTLTITDQHNFTMKQADTTEGGELEETTEPEEAEDEELSEDEELNEDADAELTEVDEAEDEETSETTDEKSEETEKSESESTSTDVTEEEVQEETEAK